VATLVIKGPIKHWVMAANVAYGSRSAEYGGSPLWDGGVVKVPGQWTIRQKGDVLEITTHKGFES
jgi:hypothetical protein